MLFFPVARIIEIRHPTLIVPGIIRDFSPVSQEIGWVFGTFIKNASDSDIPKPKEPVRAS
jgi:hypothetical protein